MTFCLDCDAPISDLELRCAKCVLALDLDIKADRARSKWEDQGDEDLVEASEEDADDR